MPDILSMLPSGPFHMTSLPMPDGVIRSMEKHGMGMAVRLLPTFDWQEEREFTQLDIAFIEPPNSP